MRWTCPDSRGSGQVLKGNLIVMSMEFSIKSVTPWIWPLHRGLVQAGGGCVTEWGLFSWHTFSPVMPIDHDLKGHGVCEYLCCSPLCPSYTVKATSSMIMPHVTRSKPKRSPLECEWMGVSMQVQSRPINSRQLTQSR